MYTKSKQPKALKISNTNYSIPTLMHEIGHAFGLADTYAEAYDDDDQKEDAADDHHDATDRAEIGNELGIVKNQPFSVMAGNMYLDDSNQSMLLFKDDIAGIRWLYRYFHFKNTDTETCHHPDYEFEMIDRQEQISGCRPRHPLIFETKQKHISSSVYLIRHVSDIDINAHDSHGNTALHYASRYGLCDVVRALLARPDIHKDKPNADGITPLVYAEQAGHARTAALLRGGKGARCRAKPKTSACASIGEEVSNANSAGRAGLLLVILLFPVLLCSVGRFTCPRAKSDWRDA